MAFRTALASGRRGILCVASIGLLFVFLLAEEPVSINEIEFLELGSSP